MPNVRKETIDRVVAHSSAKKNFVTIDSTAYLKLDTGVLIKLDCESRGYGLVVSAVTHAAGVIDHKNLNFSDYFAPVRCCPSGPAWTQTIENNNWRYPREPKNFPKESDYDALAKAIDTYIKLFM